VNAFEVRGLLAELVDEMSGFHLSDYGAYRAIDAINASGLHYAHLAGVVVLGNDHTQR
jgi:hypothetical protein